MKTYFLQFDWWTFSLNKFCFGVVHVDLENVALIDVCKQMIKDSYPDVDISEVEINVRAFNNIE